jgi:hypothetical protein
MSDTNKKVRRIRPGLTPESREDQLVALAINLAEEQLLAGTASSQVISHFLKIGSTKERIEKEILKEQKDLIKAKTEALKSEKRVEELYEEALKAMRRYAGQDSINDEDDFDEEL